VTSIAPSSTIARKPVIQQRIAFTLIEASVSLGLVSLMFLGVIILFVTASGIAIRSNAQVSAANSVGRAMERVIGDTREAYTFALPDDASGFTPPLSYAASQFETTYNSASIDTGIEITFAPMAAITVLNTAGNTLSVTPGPYSGTGVNNLWVYRADSNGTPDAAAGQYLWAYGSEEGQSVNNAIVRLCDTATNAAALPNAVQIVRVMNTGSPPAPIPYQVEFRLISSYYGYVNGSQSSESSGTTMLTGKVALVRNHP